MIEAVAKLAGGISDTEIAHHNLPLKFVDDFLRMNLFPNNPIYGSVWDKAMHAAKSYEINVAWQRWLRANGGATAAEALTYARQLAAKYGLTIYF
jgi:hypothetical protein